MIEWHMHIHESFRVGISHEWSAIINIAFPPQNKKKGANGRIPEFAHSLLYSFFVNSFLILSVRCVIIILLVLL